MRRYQYGGASPRSSITQDILYTLFIGGIIILAASSPYAGIALWRAWQGKKKYQKRQFTSTFHRLKRNNLLHIERRGNEVMVSLTPKGKEVAGYMEIEKLKIQKSKRWDGLWRVVVFDIAELRRFERNAFRGMLREIGFVHFQKSVWAQPFPCKREVNILRNFFGLSEKEVQLLEARIIGDDAHLRKFFRV